MKLRGKGIPVEFWIVVGVAAVALFIYFFASVTVIR